MNRSAGTGLMVFSIILAVVGAILAFAVTVTAKGFNLNTIGMHPALVGILGFLVSLFVVFAPGAGGAHCRRTCVPSRAVEQRIVEQRDNFGAESSYRIPPTGEPSLDEDWGPAVAEPDPSPTRSSCGRCGVPAVPRSTSVHCRLPSLRRRVRHGRRRAGTAGLQNGSTTPRACSRSATVTSRSIISQLAGARIHVPGSHRRGVARTCHWRRFGHRSSHA